MRRESLLRSRAAHLQGPGVVRVVLPHPKFQAADVEESLHKVRNAGCYVRNDVIAKNIRMYSVEDFVARLARRIFNGTERLHFHDMAHYVPRPTESSGYAVPRELMLPVEKRNRCITPSQT
ncbi:hypothetical protein ACJJTC_000796 [Scirpophaga incertulas]